MARDFITEMNKLLDGLIDGPGDLVPPLAAAALVLRLRETDPKLLTGWLDVSAVAIFTQALRDRNRARRSATQREHSRTQFAADAEAGVFSAYRLRFMIEDGSQRFLKDMTANDCLWLARDYRDRAAEMNRRADFF